MINKISFILLIFNILIPFSLITGPAIPDLTITFSGIFFLFIIIYKKNYNILFKNNIVLVSIFFWIYLLFISLFAENKYLSLRDALVFIRILLIPIFIYYWLYEEKNYLEKIILSIFIATVFISLDTIYQFTNYDSEFGFGRDLFGFIPEWYGRLTGPFGDELIPGAYLSKFSFLGLLYLITKIENTKYLNASAIIYLTIVGVTIFYSGERMALATYMMGLGFLFLFYKNKRLIFIISFISIILLSFINTKIHPFYRDYKIIESTPFHLGLKVEKEFVCKNDETLICNKIIELQPEFLQVIKNFSSSAYGEIYALGIAMYNDHKLVGVGLNNFTYLCNNDERYKNIIKNYVCVSHPHNIYLQWLVESGVLGLIFFILYLSSLFYFILIKKINEYSLLSFATLLVLFWPIMSTGSLLKNWNGVSTFYIIGICITLTKLKKKIN